MEYKQVTNDINGNPRYVFHYLDFLKDGERCKAGQVWEDYDYALLKAKKIGGKRYRGKDFGGGIVFQSYNIEETINQIKSLL